MAPEELAQRRDLHGQVVVFHHQAGPHQRQQLILAHHAIAMLDQAQQQVKGAGTQQGWLAVLQELAPGGQKLKTVKAVRIGQTVLSGMAGNGFIMALTSFAKGAGKAPAMP